MGALTGSTISSSYDMLLKTATTGGVTSTLKVIEDGLGIDSALKLSTGVVQVDGDLGVGVVPSAWSGVGGALQIGSGLGLMGNVVSSSSLLNNAYYNGSDYKLIGAGAANRLSLTSGSYDFQYAASGSADDTISFTSAMTIDSSGNVGLGTASPSAKLDCQGNAKFNHSSSNLQVDFTANNSTILNFTNGTSEGTVLRTDEYFRFDTGGSNERMRIDSSGNVGIGGTAKTKLDVIVSAVTGYSSVQNDGIVIERGGATAALNIATDYNQQGAIWFADGDAANSGQIIYDHADDSLQLGTAATERMRIDSDGNIGIGTDSPSDFHDSGLPLVVGDGSDERGLTIFSDSTNGSINFADGSHTHIGRIYYDHSVDAMNFSTNGSTGMTIDSSGNVDIGTSGPSTTNAKLHIHSGLELASDVALLISDFNNDATTYAMRIEDEDDGGELFSLKSDGGASSGKVDMMVTGEVIATGIPTSSDGSGLTTGTIYKETSTGYLKIA